MAQLPDPPDPRDEDPVFPAEDLDPFDDETVAHLDPDPETATHLADPDAEAIVDEPPDVEPAVPSE